MSINSQVESIGFPGPKGDITPALEALQADVQEKAAAAAANEEAAGASAATANEQAGIATAQAVIATDKAADALADRLLAQSAKADAVAAQGIAEAQATIATTKAGEAAASLAALTTNGLLDWAYSQSFRLVSATRDSNGAITTASIVWPDGATGTFTTDTASTLFPGAIDAWHATHVVGAVTKTITQTAVTRDADGAVTAQPAITIV